MSVTPADILAAIDVLSELTTTELEATEFEGLVELRQTVGDLIDAGKLAKDAVETAMLDKVEGTPRQVDGVVYAAGDKRKARHDHRAVEAAILEQAIQLATDRETGEIDARAAARHAVALAMQTYVSPSSRPKTGALTRALDLDPDQVTDWVKEGRELRVQD